MGAGNPTISWETKTQVPAACQPQPRQPHIIKLSSQLQKPTRKITDTWIIDTGKRETRYQLVKVHQTIRQPHTSIKVFSNKSALSIRWPKYWSFSFNISPSNEHPGLISFRMDWLDLLAVQGTLKSLLQHHSLKASILWCSALFLVQHSQSYMTTGKTTASTRRTFVSKVISLLFNMLSRLVITFLPKSKSLFISWLQPPSAVILEPKK